RATSNGQRATRPQNARAVGDHETTGKPATGNRHVGALIQNRRQAAGNRQFVSPETQASLLGEIPATPLPASRSPVTCSVLRREGNGQLLIARRPLPVARSGKKRTGPGGI